VNSSKRVMVKSVSWINTRICALHRVFDVSSFKRLCGFLPTAGSIFLDANKKIILLVLITGCITSAFLLVKFNKQLSQSKTLLLLKGAALTSLLFSLSSFLSLAAVHAVLNHPLYQLCHSAGPLMRKFNFFMGY